MKSVNVETNMCRAMMNAVIQWQVDTGLDQRIHVVTDTRYYDASAQERNIDANFQLVLSIGSNAVRHFRYTDEGFEFEARFDGVVHQMAVPYIAVLGFTLPVDETNYGFFPIPNMERIQHQLLVNSLAQKQIEAMLADPEFRKGLAGQVGGTGAPAKALEPTPFAVVGVETHDSEGNEMPTAVDLMTRKSLEQRNASTRPTFAANASGRDSIQATGQNADETGETKPLLDFGDLGGFNLPSPKSRYKGKPTLTVIQGGKK